MSDESELHDFSRLDAYMASVRRTALLNASWRPMAAGAVGAALVIGAMWIVLPKISVREVMVPNIVARGVPVDHVVPRDAPIDIPVPRIVPHDTPVDHVVVVPRDVEIQVPRIVEHPVDVEIPPVGSAPSATAPTNVDRAAPASPTLATPAPRTPQEEGFEKSEGWRGAAIAGRIVRPIRNGFVLMTNVGEQSFFPARIGIGGAFEVDPTMREDVRALIGLLARCNRMPDGTYECVALRQGREVAVPEIPITARQGRPT